MSQHSIRQAEWNELALPIRVKIRVPETGLGKAIDWLKANVAAVDYACCGAPGLGCGRAAFYLRNSEKAHTFVSAFPAVELADGQATPAYRSVG